jgi:hypothetical protein
VKDGLGWLLPSSSAASGPKIRVHATKEIRKNLTLAGFHHLSVMLPHPGIDQLSKFLLGQAHIWVDQ